MSATTHVTARSASDRTDDWPFWMVWNGSLNVTIPALEAVFGVRAVGMPFLPRHEAERLAERYNEILNLDQGAAR